MVVRERDGRGGGGRDAGQPDDGHQAEGHRGGDGGVASSGRLATAGRLADFSRGYRTWTRLSASGCYGLQTGRGARKCPEIQGFPGVFASLRKAAGYGWPGPVANGCARKPLPIPAPGPRKGDPAGDGTRLERGRAHGLAGSTPAPSADVARDGARGVTAAREIVDLEAPGSTPAGHPAVRPVRDRTAGGVLLGEDPASKPGGWGSNPHAPAGPSWSRPESRRIPGVCRAHSTFRRSRAGFDSRRGDARCGRQASPRGVGEARDPAKVEDQVRPLART